MKKIFWILFFFLCLSFNIFSSEVEIVATTENNSLTPLDMVEIFVEKLNESKYRYQRAIYQVYTNSEEQDCDWYVAILNNTVDNTKCKTVILYMRNGFIWFATTGGPKITVDNKEVYDSNEKRKDIEKSLQNAIYKYIYDANKWLGRYKKSFSNNELLALDKLSTLYELLPGYYELGIEENIYKNFYIPFNNTDNVETLEKNSQLQEITFDTELKDVMKRHNTKYLKQTKERVYNQKEKSLSKLKKFQKEGFTKLKVSSQETVFYKLDNDKIYSFVVYDVFYYMLDDIIAVKGNYEDETLKQKYHTGWYSEDGNFIMEYNLFP